MRENSTIFRENEEDPDEKSQGLAWNKSKSIEIWTISNHLYLNLKFYAYTLTLRSGAIIKEKVWRGNKGIWERSLFGSMKQKSREMLTLSTSLSPNIFMAEKKLLDFKRERQWKRETEMGLWFSFSTFCFSLLISMVFFRWGLGEWECACVLPIVVTAFTGEWHCWVWTLGSSHAWREAVRWWDYTTVPQTLYPRFFYYVPNKILNHSSSLLFSSFSLFFYLFLTISVFYFFHKYFWIILFYTFPRIALIKLNTDGLSIKIKKNIKKAALWASLLDAWSVGLGISPVH